MIGDARW